MWIINNSLDVINVIGTRQFQATSVSTWDFSTLYTSIPHGKLKDQIHELLEIVYTTRQKSYIATNNYHTFWTNEKKSTNMHYYTCRDLCRAVDFLVDNIFVNFGGMVYRQVIGIPMGTNSAPLLADLFLHAYEYDFMMRTMKTDMGLAIRYSKTFRYIDDLLSINNADFENFIGDIYPSELELKNTTVTPDETTYLDTTINIGERNAIQMSIYDKREDFDFEIVNFPYLDSNIPQKPAYGVYISQLVRYARICCKKSDFMYRHQRLSLKLQDQGFEFHRLVKSFNKFYKNHYDKLQKYGSSSKELGPMKQEF